MTYYVMQHIYGAMACDANGDHIGHVSECASRADVQDFLDHDPRGDYRDCERTRLYWRDRRDRRAIREYLREVADYGSNARNVYSMAAREAEAAA